MHTPHFVGVAVLKGAKIYRGDCRVFHIPPHFEKGPRQPIYLVPTSFADRRSEMVQGLREPDPPSKPQGSLLPARAGRASR